MESRPPNVNGVSERFQALIASPRVRHIGLAAIMTLGLAGSQIEHDRSVDQVHVAIPNKALEVASPSPTEFEDSAFTAIETTTTTTTPPKEPVKLRAQNISYERLIANPHKYHDEAVAIIGNGNVGGIWRILRNCEGSYTSKGKYFGAYQFLVSTWNSLAAKYRPDLYGVRPDMAAPADQDYMGILNEAVSGFEGQYPKCTRDHGLSRHHPEYFNPFLGIMSKPGQEGDQSPTATTTTEPTPESTTTTSTTQPSQETTTTTEQPQQTTTTTSTTFLPTGS